MQYQFSHLIPPPPWINRICATETWYPFIKNTLQKTQETNENTKNLKNTKNIELIHFDKWNRTESVDALFVDSPDTKNMQPYDLAQITHAISPNGLFIIANSHEPSRSMRKWKQQAIGLSLKKLHPRGFQTRRHLQRLGAQLKRKEFYLFMKGYRQKKQVSIALPIVGQKDWQKQVLQWIQFFEEYRLYETCELILIFDGMEAVLPNWKTEQGFWNQASAFMSVRHYRPFGKLQCFLSAVQFSQARYFFWVEEPSVPCYEMFSLLDKLLACQKEYGTWVFGKKILSDAHTGMPLRKAKATPFLLLDAAARKKVQSLRWQTGSSVLAYCHRRLFWKRCKKANAYVHEHQEKASSNPLS